MIIITPRATEKAYGETKKNIYVFDVPLSANKQQIADTVAKQYEVTVKGVRVVVQSGKAVRFSRGKHRNPGVTARKDTKKAYVTLASGSSIQVFDQAESEAK